MRTGVWLVVAFLLVPAATSSAYSVLTHEQIVDLRWKDQIEPLLLERFPATAPDELRKAHAYAYGGCVVHDMGYYPFGSRYFSDLVHYVRSGDFVSALLQQASDVDEYAFALGALSHYASDVSGHPSVNRAVALGFPKLRARYGDEVTYAQSPMSHIRTEFGFDLVQVAKNHYTSDGYHDFIGFQVARPVLERAFLQTYRLELGAVIDDVGLAIGTFRWAVSRVIPELTRAALDSRLLAAVDTSPNASERRYLYDVSRNQFQKEWGTNYRRPGLKTRIAAFLLRHLPKIGPLKALAIKVPTTETEDLYVKSIDKTVEHYTSLLRDVGNGSLQLPNADLDTANAAHAGEYVLSDKAHARLLHDLAKAGFGDAPPELRASLLAFYTAADDSFYAGADPAIEKGGGQDWNRTIDELIVLQALPLER